MSPGEGKPFGKVRTFSSDCPVIRHHYFFHFFSASISWIGKNRHTHPISFMTKMQNVLSVDNVANYYYLRKLFEKPDHKS